MCVCVCVCVFCFCFCFCFFVDMARPNLPSVSVGKGSLHVQTRVRELIVYIYTPRGTRDLTLLAL